MQNNNFIQQWSALNNSATAAMQELGEINAKAMERLTQRQMEMMNVYMESGAKQLEVMGQAKGFQDVTTAQTKLYAEMQEKLMDNARQTVDILSETKNELAAWVEKAMQTAMDNMPKEK